MTGKWTKAEHREGLALFIAREHRPRFKAVLAKKKFDLSLNHYGHALDQRYAYSLNPEDQSPERMLAILKKHGAPAEAYVLSEDPFVGPLMQLEDALRDGFLEGCLISCIPGVLGSYHDHDYTSEQYILLRQRA